MYFVDCPSSWSCLTFFSHEDIDLGEELQSGSSFLIES